jgi:hypothetical protein
MGAPRGNKNASKGGSKRNVYSHTKSGKVKKPWPYWNPKGKGSFIKYSKTTRGKAEIAAIMGRNNKPKF